MDGYAKLKDFKPGTKVVVVRCPKHDLPLLPTLCDCESKGVVLVVRNVRLATLPWDVVLEDIDGGSDWLIVCNHKQLLILE